MQSTGVQAAGADLGEGAARRRSLTVDVVPPAGEGALGLESTGVIHAGADLGEGAGRRRGLAVLVQPPAGQGALGLQSAGVIGPRADLAEGAGRGRGLAVDVVPPAGQRAVGPQPAGMVATGAEGLGEPGGRQRRLFGRRRGHAGGGQGQERGDEQQAPGQAGEANKVRVVHLVSFYDCCAGPVGQPEPVVRVDSSPGMGICQGAVDEPCYTGLTMNTQSSVTWWTTPGAHATHQP